MNTVDSVIRRAKLGDVNAVNSLMNRYRNYLRLLVGKCNRDYKHLARRFDSSDVVQNTLLDAFRDIGKFNGQTEAELMAWLRRLVACNLADLVRTHHAEKRDINRQQFGRTLSQSSQHLSELANRSHMEVGGAMSKQEAMIMLSDSLARLPDDYREVIVMRHLQRASFEEIAVKMNRTSGAVRMLWTRAIANLKAISTDQSEP